MAITGLSGNEIYCLNLKGLSPGNLVLGNSVFSMGFLGGIGSGVRGFVGGEITQYTSIISEGRRLALQRLEGEVSNNAGVGSPGISTELVMHAGNIEFLSIGSTLHSTSGQAIKKFGSSADGQELYCQIDSGYSPVAFVFGNVAYSIGVGRSFLGGLKTLRRGEISEYTDIFTKTRNLALDRIVQDASSKGANSVVGIKTTIIPFASYGVQEMLMVGTASSNSNLSSGSIVTSDLTSQEMWNVTKMGYSPIKLLLGTSVYSLGFVGGIGATLKSFVKGEISQLTSLIYEAREKSLGKISDEANTVGADAVLGVKTYVYSLGSGLIEFLAIGTAVKRNSNVSTATTDLIPQAIISDKDTFFNSADFTFGIDLNNSIR